MFKTFIVFYSLSRRFGTRSGVTLLACSIIVGGPLYLCRDFGHLPRPFEFLPFFKLVDVVSNDCTVLLCECLVRCAPFSPFLNPGSRGCIWRDRLQFGSLIMPLNPIVLSIASSIPACEDRSVAVSLAPGYKVAVGDDIDIVSYDGVATSPLLL